MTPTENRKLVAIMFTDIVGYTALMQGDEQTAVKARKRHRAVFEAQHSEFGGNIIQYYGDGTLSIFPSAVEAVRCAVELQRQLSSGDVLVPVRIGIHIGDIVHTDTEVYGDGVNVASRIESLGVPGAILISDRLEREVRNQPDIPVEHLGSFLFKNVSYPIDVYAVSSEGIEVPARTELKGKTTTPVKSIAVLPLVNMSASEDNAYFSDGMTEEIINALTRIEGLKVTSRTSSFHFKGKNIPIRKIAGELGVSTILEGSVRLSGQQMRITVQLIDAMNDIHFWSETFDRSLNDVFKVQDEVSLLIADKLREHLGHLEIGDHLVEPQAVPPEIYTRYLKGRYLMLKMGKGDIEEAIAVLSDVLAEYPDYAYAHLGLHLAYTLMATIGFMPAAEAFGKGAPHLQRAIELDPNLPECQLNQAYIAFLQKWDLDETYSHLQKARELRPTVDYYQSMASVLVAEAKYRASMNYIATAIELDPFSEINYHLKGFVHYCREEYETSITYFRRSLSLKEGSQVSILYVGQALILLGRADEALEFFKQCDRESAPMARLGGIALADAALGNREAASSGISELESMLSTDKADQALNLLILCKHVLGDSEGAIEMIEKGVEYRLPMMVYVFVEPLLKDILSDDRVVAMKKIVLGGSGISSDKPRKYKQALLEEEALNSMRQQLIGIMESEVPYLNPELSLRQLADEVGIPANKMSQLLNEGFGQNFSEFVNTYRLEAFKEKLIDADHQHLTILAIAFESGFNSKTVFNTFFKKTMGMTPNAYRKSILNSSE